MGWYGEPLPPITVTSCCLWLRELSQDCPLPPSFPGILWDEDGEASTPPEAQWGQAGTDLFMPGVLGRPCMDGSQGTNGTPR